MQRLFLTLFILLFIIPKCFGQHSSGVEKKGIYLGLSLGTWVPDNANKVLGKPLLLGFLVDFKDEKNAYGLTFDLIGWPNHHTTEPIKIKFGDSILTRNEFFGAHLTIDYARELWRKERLIFEGICGIGYGRLTYYNPDKDTEIGKSSIILNPGLSFRYLIGQKLFLQVKTQYCIANYNLNDNVSTNLQGNYLTTKLIFGSR
ncbi:hypothetical protein DNU06_15965 [Putridiphycobacter roseus]|uniref:Outer membrane protein beta-barrel domain-containing protein n=1 Tax=Putridiphycobacter roseus TaxID=2219161 RepID=A0A2W1MWU4_9FLAO|nr:hypothetical protein [Putridiphycobacter roseus]PZE15874.1 hypothetical protein DNU06_15965 [Putridiphycobacter roseus]